MKPHERYWEDNFPEMNENMRAWFGGDGSDHHRIYPRKLMADMGYTSVLDAGAGLCAEYFGFKSEYPSIAYSALDITPSFVKEAKAFGIDIEQGSIESMPYDSDAFDCVYIRDTLRHLPSIETAISEGLRVARHELVIVFARPLVRGASDEFRFDVETGIHNNRWSKQRVERILRDDKSVVWFYFQRIEGKNGPDDLLRVFKTIGSFRKNYLFVHETWARFRFFIRPKFGAIVRAILGRQLAGNLVKAIRRR